MRSKGTVAKNVRRSVKLLFLKTPYKSLIQRLHVAMKGLLLSMVLDSLNVFYRISFARILAMFDFHMCVMQYFL